MSERSGGGADGGPLACARRRSAGRSGQATVELVAALPLAVAIVLAVVSLFVAAAWRGLAAHAAQAGAMALLQGRPADAAARDAVPGLGRGAMRVDVQGRRVIVVLRPPALPGRLAGLLAERAEASADPGAHP